MGPCTYPGGSAEPPRGQARGPFTTSTLSPVPTDAPNTYVKNEEQANLFLLPLDDERHWYRYHHLFSELLRHRLRRKQPELVAVLHKRASTWYQQQQLIPEAIQHALAAEDLQQPGPGSRVQCRLALSSISRLYP